MVVIKSVKQSFCVLSHYGPRCINKWRMVIIWIKLIMNFHV